MKYFIIILTIFSSQALFANEDISKKVQEAIMENLKYLEQDDSVGAMSTIHTQSTSYLPTKNALAQILSNYKLSYELISYQFVAYDNELAYVRVKQRTKKISGPAFNNNEIDMVQIFKQEEGVWKLWAQANMEISFIN